MPLGPVHPSLSLPIQLQPGIPPQTAQILSLIFTSTYVGSLYLAQQFITRPQKTLNVSLRNKVDGNTAPAPTPPPIAASGTEDVVLLNGAKVGPEVGTRDHPDTIRVRIKAVNIASIGSIGGVWWVVKSVGGYSAFSAVRLTIPCLMIITFPTKAKRNVALRYDTTFGSDPTSSRVGEFSSVFLVDTDFTGWTDLCDDVGWGSAFPKRSGWALDEDEEDLGGNGLD